MTTHTSAQQAEELVASFRQQASSELYREPDDVLYFSQNRVPRQKARERILMERHIVRHFVKVVLAQALEPLSITIFDGECTVLSRSRNVADIMANIGACDEETLIVRVGSEPSAPKVGTVYLVYGNDGWDVMADTTESEAFNALLASTNDLADALSEV